jgi:hypothetical protein
MTQNCRQAVGHGNDRTEPFLAMDNRVSTSHIQHPHGTMRDHHVIADYLTFVSSSGLCATRALKFHRCAHRCSNLCYLHKFKALAAGSQNERIPPGYKPQHVLAGSRFHLNATNQRFPGLQPGIGAIALHCAIWSTAWT